MVKRWPVHNWTGRPPASGPVRIFGPCRSARIAMGFARRAEASRTRAMVRACSAYVPWEKLSRATSIPARISRSMTCSESLAGPSVHTILALRKLMPSIHSTRAARSPILFGGSEIAHDVVEKPYAFAKAVHGDALIICMHPCIVRIGEEKRQQAVGLHLVKAKLGGVGRPSGQKRQNDGAREILGRDLLDALENRAVQLRRRRIFAGVGRQLKPDLRVVDGLAKLRDEFLNGMPRQKPDIQVGGGFRWDHVVAKAAVNHGWRDGIAQHGVPHGALLREMLGGQVRALRLFEGAHPLGRVIVLD